MFKQGFYSRISEYSKQYSGKVLFGKIIRCTISNFLLANHAETAYLSFRDGELFNDVRLVQWLREKVVVHTFLGLSKAGLLRQPSCRNY